VVGRRGDVYCYIATRQEPASAGEYYGMARVPLSAFSTFAVEILEYAQGLENGATALARHNGYIYSFSDHLSGPKSIVGVSEETFSRVGSTVLEGSASTGGPEVLKYHQRHLYACDDTQLWRVPVG